MRFGRGASSIIACALTTVACSDRPGGVIDATDTPDCRPADSGCSGHAGMISVPVSGGGAYYIDSSETTNAAYAAFLASNPSTADQPVYCGWNSSYVPTYAWPAVARDNDPVQGVNWCDAHAYCIWAGKHLCGRIGGGGPLSYSQGDWMDPAKSEWHNACSASGTKAYPYGDTYTGNTCIGQDYDGMAGTQTSDVVHPVKDASGCVGGYAGLYDMSGNVAEWEDTCDGTAFGKDDICLARGGGAYDPAYNLQCGHETINSRGAQAARLGFRCCAN